MKIGLDIDDVLLTCTSIVVDRLESRGLRVAHPIDWGFKSSGPEVSAAAMETFMDPSFYVTQTPMEGAVDFVNDLVNRGHEVYVVTAVNTEFMALRVAQVMGWFPNIPKQNIITSSDKSLVNGLDILVDDGYHNIRDSHVPFPILFKQEWSGGECALMVDGSNVETRYQEVLNIVDWLDANFGKEHVSKPTEVVCLVGPSGSGKTTIINMMTSLGMFYEPVSTTTRPRRPDDKENSYHFVDEAQFQFLMARGAFVETTEYHGHRYGLTKDELKQPHHGKIAVMAMDMDGAEAIKAEFGVKAIMVFVSRPRKDMVEAIYNRDTTPDVAVSRINTLEAEAANVLRCDYTIHNNKKPEYAVRQILDIINRRK